SSTSLVKDRNSNRAHKFEKATSDAPVPRLDIEAVGRFLGDAEALTNNLSLVLSSKTLYFHDINNPSADASAQDVVDLILLMALDQASDAIRAAGGRDTLYEQVHARHDATGADGSFNEPRYVWPDSA